MNSIHEAIRKFRPDLKLDGWTAPERPMPAAAAYPEFIKPEMVVRGLAASDPAEPGASRPAPEPKQRASAWRPVASLALVFALAIAFGAGLALRPAKVGKVEARTAPEHQPVAMPITAKLTEPILQNEPVQAAPAVVAVKPQIENSNEPGTVKLAAIPKHSLAPIRKPAESVSLQPVKVVVPASGGTLTKLTPVVAAATAPTTSVTVAAKMANKTAVQVSTIPTTSAILAAMQPKTAAPEQVNVARPSSAVNGDIPEILYEADSPQSVPASTGELAAAPVAAVKTARPAQASAPAPASNGNRIQGIFWDKQRPMALLGDNIIEVGSETPLGKVVVIEKNYVVFERDGKRISIAP